MGLGCAKHLARPRIHLGGLQEGKRNTWSELENEHLANVMHQYGNYAFQVPTMTRMDVFICDRQMTREYSTLGNDQMSFQAVMSEV